MQHEELKQALRQIGNVLTDPRLEPGQRNQLQKAKRELEKVARSGKVDKDRIFRAVQIVATVPVEIVRD
jgi:hypothetical protein